MAKTARRNVLLMPWHSNFERNCLLKRTFHTEERAERFCRKMRNSHGWSLRAYKCDMCDGWHTARAEDPEADTEMGIPISPLDKAPQVE